ncbi:MAG: hypothetical protein Q7U37_04090 [Gallionella sp.]|nr:hypothetical protein [Gallionella sp.]
MKIKLALAAIALLSIGTVVAEEQTENGQQSQTEQPANPDVGFGGGMNIGLGGSAGSASSLSGGLGSPVGTPPADQSFGGGTPTQSAGSGPLATPPAGGAGGAGGAGAMGGTGGVPSLFP